VRRARLEDLVLAFTAADVLVGGGVLLVAHLVPLAGLLAAGAVAGFLLFHRTQREAALWLLVAALVVLPVGALVALRPSDAPVQDSLLLTDAAATRLLHGASPYGHDYIDSAALRAFWLPEIPVNPLLAHYPYPPAMILLALPMRVAGLSAAWLWPPAVVALGLAARGAAGRAGLVAAAMSPLLLLDGLSLFNDVFFLAAGLAAWALLSRGRALPAGVLAGLALCFKQPALVLALPLLWLAWHRGPRAAAGFVAGGVAAAALVIGPFLAWNAAAFVADTATYFYGSGVDSFPIRGPGLAGLLLAAGWLPSRWAAFPAALIQVPILAAIAVVGWWRLGRRPWLWAGLVGVVLFAFGRTLAPNYVTVVGVLLTLDIASQLDPRPGGAAIGRPVERPARNAGVDGTA
jgi:hypothetical protein